MTEIINALLENEMASDRQEAEEIIKAMKEGIANGKDIEDVLYQYELELDYAIDLFE